MKVTELIEDGIRAYTRGDLAAAQRRWREALALSPGDERTLSYLALLEPPPAGEAALPAPLAPPPRDARATRTTLEAYAPSARIDRATVEDYAPSPWEEEPAEPAPVVVSDGDGLDLASVEEQSGIYPLVPRNSSAPGGAGPTEVDVWLQGARELFELGDFSGSLQLIERVLKVHPSHAEAREYLAHNEATLIALYESKLGPPGAIPRLAISPEEVTWLSLDHRAGFLLAQIDGSVSYEDLFALSGLPRLDTARILANLLQEGVIR